MSALIGLREKVATLISELCTLVESHVLVVPVETPFFTQPLFRPPPLIFDLFNEEDEAQTISAKREHG